MSPLRRSRPALRVRRPGVLVVTLFLLFASAVVTHAATRAPAPIAMHAPADDGPPRPPHNRVLVRHNIYTADTSIINAYRRGVAAMKARPDTQKTSWMFQANIHGSLDTLTAAFNQCQHSSYFFLSWHRMYLYYFERIVRAASGDTNFALPYWNYTDDPTWRYIPRPFREPNNNTNTLWATRNAGLNAGTSRLALDAIDYRTAMASRTFSLPPAQDPDTTFGGGHAGPRQFDYFTGLLEMQPHNEVHVALEGLMEDPITAARDPIFWLHHANIDRLWEQWKNSGGGRTDPTDTLWLRHRFTFYDEHGAAVTLTGRQIINTADSLGYRYEPVPMRARRAIQRPRRARRPFQIVESAELRAWDSVWVDRKPFTLGARRETVQMTEVPGKRLRATDARRVALTLEGVEVEKSPGLMYDILVKPAGADRDTVYVGSIDFFDLVGMRHHAHGGRLIVNLMGRIPRLPPAFRNAEHVDVIIEPVWLTEGPDAVKSSVPPTRVRGVTLSVR